MSRLIGIGGRLAAGKDVVADHLVEKHGWVKLGMSDPLLDMALILNPRVQVIPDYDDKYGRTAPDPKYPFLQEVVDRLGYVKAKEIPEVRTFLQRLGTDIGRNRIDENMWIDQAEKNIYEHMKDGSNVVITGIRFENELNMIGRWNRTRTDATSVWVDRPKHTIGSAATHESEQLTSDGFDLILTNDSTIEALKKKVDDELAA